MKKIVTPFCALLLLFSGHCKKISCLEQAGTLTSVQRIVAPFHQIILTDNVHLILTQDTVESIRVEAGNNLQPNIITTVEKEILTISNKTECSTLKIPSKNIRVYVSVKQLDRIEYNGSGDITSTNTLQANDLTIVSQKGAGNVEISINARSTTATIFNESPDFILHGRSVVCYAYTNARGTIDFKDFEVESMHIGYAGVRDATITATKSLEATIYHTGNVYFKGKPTEVVTKYYSSGKLYPAP